MSEEPSAPAVPPALVAKPGMLARLLPPMTSAQVAVMAQMKLPCC